VIRKLAPLIADRELESNEHDAFGHKHFSELLERIVIDPATTPPYSIGLLGGWGVGKSSIKALTENLLKEYNNHQPSQRVHCVTFNAWRFGGENLKRALLREVFIDLGGTVDVIDNKLHQTTVGNSPAPKPKKEQRLELQELVHKILVGAVIYLIFLAFLRVFTNFSAYYAWYTQQQLDGIAAGMTLAISTALGAWLLNFEKLYISPITQVWQIEPPRSSAEQFEHMLLNQLGEFKRRNPPFTRIAVFVDDLDRLSSDEMIAALEAIRSFLELPRSKLPKNLGVIFIVSCDEQRISEALSKRAAKGDMLLMSEDRQHDARRYLDRIFQYRLEIPPLPQADMRQYARKKIERDAPEFVRSLEARGGTLEDILERLIHVGVVNPRQALQLINAFLQAWWIADAREFDGVGNDKAGGLRQGTVSKHAQMLAVMSVLRVDFADFYQRLELEPRLFEAFQTRFVRFVHRDEAVEIEQLLEHYVSKEGGDNDQVLSKFRPLRRYLSSVQGVELPSNLEPFLRLSEDAISREFGDGARLIYDSLVSGDPQAVLNELKLTNNTNSLDSKQVKLLRGMLENIESDVLERRINAAGVIAKLSPRLKSDGESELLGRVAGWANGDLQMRQRIGAEHIGRFVKAAPQAVKNTLLEATSKMALSGEFITRTIEPHQKIGDCNFVLKLVLEIQQSGELPTLLAKRWADWLKQRKIGDADDSFPMESVIALADQFPNLTSIWAEPILEGLAQSKLTLNTFDPTVTAAWENALYNELQRGNFVAWEHLATVISEGAMFSAKFAFEQTRKSLGQLPPSIQNTIIAAAAELLEAQLIASDNHTIENAQLFEGITQWLKAHGDVVGEDTWSQVSSMAIQAGIAENANTSFAFEVATILDDQGAEGSHAAIAGWLEVFPKDSSKALDFWLGEHAHEFNEDNEKALYSKLTEISDESEIDTDEEIAWLNIVENLNRDQLTIRGKQYIAELWGRVQQQASRVQTNREWIKTFLPTLKNFIDETPIEAGDALYTLFSNAASYPELFADLCQIMHGSWRPAGNPKKYGSSYSAGAIADLCSTVLTNYYTEVYASSIFQTLSELAKYNATKATLVIKYATAMLVTAHVVNALSGLKQFSDSITAPNLQAIGNVIPLDNTEDVSLMKELLDSIWIKPSSSESVTSYTKSLLASPPREFTNKADFVLASWFESHPITSEIIELILDDSLNDEQTARLFSQVLAKVTFEQYKSLLPKLLAMSNKPRTQDLALALDTSPWRQDASDMEQLAECWVQAFLSALTENHYQHLLDNLKTLNVKRKAIGENQLKRTLKSDPDLNESQKERIGRTFDSLKPLFRQ
jgi:KAP family P-loop domain